MCQQQELRGGRHALGRRSLAERWNGTKWSVVSTPTSKNGVVFGVGCPSKSNCMSVGIGDNFFVIRQRWKELVADQRLTSTEWNR